MQQPERHVQGIHKLEPKVKKCYDFVESYCYRLIITIPDIIATQKIAIGTISIPIVNGSIANFPDLRDHDQVLMAAHITANALITPIAI